MNKSFVAAGLALFLATVPLMTQAAGERSSQPIQIKSDSLLTDSVARNATFTGKVTARQGDVTIYADKLVVTYSDKANEVERVEAFGNVRISQGDRMAHAGHASYDSKGGKIVLDTDPKVFQGNDVVTGKIITYFVDEQRSEVTGGPEGRVEAVIHPREKGKDGAAKP
jgi:lipopolysaccharide export system protein LptA